MNPKCIDFMLTNRESSFQSSCVIETGRSDFHKMILTVLKFCLQNTEPKIISNRDFKNSSDDRFRSSLYTQRDPGDKLNVISCLILGELKKDETAPKKQKYITAYNGSFMYKEIRKAIMKGLD